MEDHVHCENCGKAIDITTYPVMHRNTQRIHCYPRCHIMGKGRNHQIRLKGMMVKKPNCPYHKGEHCTRFIVNGGEPYCSPTEHCKLKYSEGGLI